MPHTTEPNPQSFAAQLPAGTYYELVRTLRLTLPPPLTDCPEDLARRDHSAIARIAALCPANAAEADIAALYVAASEQWKTVCPSPAEATHPRCATRVDPE